MTPTSGDEPDSGARPNGAAGREDVGPAGAGTDPGDPAVRVDQHRSHRAGAQQQRVVGGHVRAMAGGLNGEREGVPARGQHRPADVGGAGRLDHDGRVRVERAVEGVAVLVVASVAGQVDGAGDGAQRVVDAHAVQTGGRRELIAAGPMSSGATAGLTTMSFSGRPPSTVTVYTFRAVTRAEIPALCADLAERLRGRGAGVVICDVAAVGEPDVVTVEALARLRLTARRHGCALHVSRRRPAPADPPGLPGPGRPNRGGRAGRRAGTGGRCRGSC